MIEDVELDVASDRTRRRPSVHRWWSRRGAGYSMVAVLLTDAPELAATDIPALRSAATNPKACTKRVLENSSVLDLCAGACSVAAAADQLGASVTAVDLHPIPILIGLAELVYPGLYEDVDLLSRGQGPGDTWQGLSTEITAWSEELLKEAEARAGDFWLPGIRGVIWSAFPPCPQCGERPDNSRIRIGIKEHPCPKCGTVYNRSERVAPKAIKVVGENGELLPVDVRTAELLDSASYPQGFEEDRVSALGPRGKPFLFPDTFTPRQAHVLRAFQEAFRSVREELAGRSYSSDHAAAILTYLALALTSQVEFLNKSTWWTGRFRRAVNGFDRPFGLTRSREAGFEAGGGFLRSLYKRRITDIESVIAANGRRRGVEVRQGDMTKLDLPANSFNLVVWDPPYYDNVNYDSCSLPLTRFLESLIGDLHPRLHWPTDPTSLNSEFDRSGYEGCLLAAASEVCRVLGPDGQLGVFWISQAESMQSDLDQFLAIVESSGLELVQSFALRESSSPLSSSRQSRTPIFLIFRKTQATPQPSDASVLLKGTLEGRRMMFSGILELVERHLEDEDLEDLIPCHFKGSRSQRLAEAILSSPDPKEFLRLLPARHMREYAIEWGQDADELLKMRRDELASVVFQLLGWSIPQQPAFTIGGALDEALVLGAELRLARGETEIRGRAGTAFGRIEQVLEFSVIAWSSWLRGDRWQECVKSIAKRSERLTFGQWKMAFIEFPKRFAAERTFFERIEQAIEKYAVSPAWDDAVKKRNAIAHPEGKNIDWQLHLDGFITTLEESVERLRKLDELGVLPRVLQPVSEVRDAYGRITLRLVGNRRQHVEFLMTEPSDLTQPVVVLMSGANPREVDPPRLSAPEITRRAGISG